jgi:ketosteroid isomerase-like protein
MLRTLLLTTAALALLGPPLPAQSGPVHDLTSQVFAAESSFAATMANRDLEAFAAFVAPEAVFLGKTPLRGRDAVIAAWRRYFDGAEAPFSWRPETVEVLPSGTLALTSGPVYDPGGKQTNTFTSIWRLDPDGRWRVIFDRGCPVDD